MPLAYRLLRANPTGIVAATLAQHGFTEVGAAGNTARRPGSATASGSASSSSSTGSSAASAFNVLWAGQNVPAETLRGLCGAQRVNHFPRSNELTRKDRLHVNVSRMAKAKGRRLYAFVPRTFLLPAEYAAFHAAWRRHHRPYIVKPAASSCGRGIYIVTHPSQVPLCVGTAVWWGGGQRDGGGVVDVVVVDMWR